MLGKLLASSSVLSIRFGSRIAVQRPSLLFPWHFEVLLTAEPLPRQRFGANYIIGVRQSAGHCVVLNLFNILRTL